MCSVVPSVSSFKCFKILFFILFCLNLFIANGQDSSLNRLHKLVISVSDPVLLKNTFALGSFYRNKIENVPVKGTVKANALIINFKPPREGLYKFRLGKNIETDFLLSFYEETTRLNLILKDSLYEFNIEGVEAEAYSKLGNIMLQKQQATTEGNLQRERISEVDPRYYELKQHYKESLDSVKEIYNTMLAGLRLEYKGTYTAEVLIPVMLVHTRFASPELYRVYDNHHAYYHRHYFDSMPLTDNRILNHPAFITQVTNYLGNYLGEYDEDFLRATNYLQHLNATPEVNEFLGLNLLSALYKNQQMNAVAYVLDNYTAGCTASGDLKVLTDAILNNPVKIGAPLPQAQVYGYNSDTFHLPNILLSTPNYVVIFWRSDCSHCRETLSMLRNKRTDSAWRIVTVQLNTEPNPKFDESLLSYRWLNYHCGDDLKKVLATYKIVKTPAIYQIDGRQNVVKYSTNISDIPIVFRPEEKK